MLCSVILTGLSLVASGLGACTRDQLQDATRSYLNALTTGNVSLGNFAAAGAAYQENDVPMNMTAGVLSQAIAISFNRSIFDTTQCASYSEIIATAKHPYVIGTRLELTDNKVTKIESTVCDAGDWLFNATGSLYYTTRENWATIPEGKRDTREVIKAAGDAYIDAWGDSTVNPPFAKNCARLEGGSYITSSCKLNFPPPFNATNRRYTIDEEVGAVNIFHNFPFIDASLPRQPGTQTSNSIRVEGGQIRYIHENTVCSARNCGR